MNSSTQIPTYQSCRKAIGRSMPSEPAVESINEQSSKAPGERVVGTIAGAFAPDINPGRADTLKLSNTYELRAGL